MFYQVERPCGMPDTQWWNENCKIKTFKTVTPIGFKVRPISELNNMNEAGLRLNPARSQGIDWQNVRALELSFINQGFDTTKMPPIVLTDGKVIDGNTRVEALRNIEQGYICVYEVEIKEGYDIEDVYDEIGLGMNNHLASKPIQKSDCVKRLALFFKRMGITEKQKGIEWFSTFDHPFTKDQVNEIVDKVVKNKRVEDTMSPFKMDSARKWLEQNGKETDVVMLNCTGTKRSKETYFLRTLNEVLERFDKTSEILPIVGFVSNVEAEDVDEARKSAEVEIKRLNKAINNLSVKIREAHAKGEDFELLQLDAWMPQVTDKEHDLVKV